jgi:hypothetical protein
MVPDEPLTDLPQKNVLFVYYLPRNEEERHLFKLGLIKPTVMPGLMHCHRECRRMV